MPIFLIAHADERSRLLVFDLHGARDLNSLRLE
jgi:hypothetical protein